MNKVIVKDIAIRALKTFVQAFLASVAIGVTTVQDVSTLKALLIAGLSAGISAVWNTIILQKKS